MTAVNFQNKLSTPNLKFLPLYRQVAEFIKQRIVERYWEPGAMLPSEFKLADDLNVSQGTVRKALSELTDAKILTRRQGVGTFVSEHTAQDALFRFFPLQMDGASVELPTALVLEKRIIDFDADVYRQLELSSTARVLLLKRMRMIQGVICLIENIYVSDALFPGLAARQDIPHTLYHFYQSEYNQTVHKTSDRIKASALCESDAEHLGIPHGSPVLVVQRITKSIDDKVLEYRESICRTDEFHYQVELS